MIQCHAEIESSPSRQFVRLHFKDHNDPEPVTAGALTLLNEVWFDMRTFLQGVYIYTEELVIDEGKV